MILTHLLYAYLVQNKVYNILHLVSLNVSSFLNTYYIIDHMIKLKEIVNSFFTLTVKKKRVFSI